MSQQNRGPDHPPAESVAEPASVYDASKQHSPVTASSLQGNANAQNNSTQLQPKPQPSSVGKNAITSRPPHIPALSPTTTELLARINGNKVTNIKRESVTTGSNEYNKAPFFTPVQGTSNISMSHLRNIKMPQSVLGLPAFPFTTFPTSTAVATESHSPQNPAVPVHINIAPKPAENLREFPAISPQRQLGMVPAATTLSQIPSFAMKQQKKTTPRKRKSTGKGARRGKKSRRPGDSDDDNIRAGDSSSDESSDFTPSATQTKSGRQVHRPALFVPPPAPSPVVKRKFQSEDAPNNGTAAINAPARKRKKVYRKGKEPNVICRHCQRGHSPLTNMIVFCDGCNRAWHQFCHDPPIEKEVIEMKDAEWFCRGCKSMKSSVVEEVAQQPMLPNEIEPTYRVSQFDLGPSAARVGGDVFSSDEKCGYLSGLSHAALVDMIMDISDRNPSLAVFPSNLKDLQRSKFITSFTSSTVPLQSGPSATILPADGQNEESPDLVLRSNGITTTSAPTTSNRKHRRKRRYEDSSDASSSEYEMEEHRLYPRVGNGFRLPPEAEDLHILLDDPACPTFSYALHGHCNTGMKATNTVSNGLVS